MRVATLEKTALDAAGTGRSERRSTSQGSESPCSDGLSTECEAAHDTPGRSSPILHAVDDCRSEHASARAGRFFMREATAICKRIVCNAIIDVPRGSGSIIHAGAERHRQWSSVQSSSLLRGRELAPMDGRQVAAPRACAGRTKHAELSRRCGICMIVEPSERYHTLRETRRCMRRRGWFTGALEPIFW